MVLVATRHGASYLTLSPVAVDLRDVGHLYESVLLGEKKTELLVVPNLAQPFPKRDLVRFWSDHVIVPFELATQVGLRAAACPAQYIPPLRSHFLKNTLFALDVGAIPGETARIANYLVVNPEIFAGADPAAMVERFLLCMCETMFPAPLSEVGDPEQPGHSC